MGVAQGTLLKDQIESLYPQVYNHFEQQIIQSIDKYIGEDLSWFVAEYGLESALELTYELTKDYSGSYFFEEMQGIADATNITYGEILRLHMLPELVKAQCSIYGAWDTATPNGELLQLRALDWDTSGPLQKYPVVTIYHPNSGNGHPFANVGWAGWISSITGMSSSQMGMSEKVTDHVFGTTSRIGYPFNFLIRDILQFDDDLDAAISRMANARRTCAIWLGCGDGKKDIYRANLFQYSHSVLNVIDPDTNIKYPSNSSRYIHPNIDNIVYWGINQPCFSALLEEWNGNITAFNTIRNIIPLSQTGDLHAAIYDLTNMLMWVSNAKAPDETGPLNAYERSFVQFDMNSLFNEQPPKIKQ